jgi:KDO2-lipid IV(A) lauroyltransferase
MRALLIKILLHTLALFPLPVLHYLGYVLGRLLYAFTSETKTITIINIRHCFPDKSEQEQDDLIKRSLIESAKTFTESGAIWCWPKEKLLPLLKETPSTDQLKALAQQKKGAIIITPHLGAWEIAGFYSAHLRPTTAMYRPPRVTELETLIKRGREQLGLKMAPTDHQGIRMLGRALKQQEFIGILPDQDPGQNSGIYVPFFGRPANTMTLVSRLAMKYQCPIFCIYAERLPQGQGYLIHCKSVPPELSNGTLEQSVATLNQLVESCVRHIPDQYQWSYKRFKSQPPGIPDIYQEGKRKLAHGEW